ncbi:MFS transporter [Lysinibacillus sp. 2017]|uniref:peptide MFS transporter n=1 Tax=unclassified Lysinibacillus TaxID=2636778 RepID=UPI000D52914B|nr:MULTISPECIES: peptide MFS transporter [unclassified Lysinibacillus]AWE08965.1 MFS transporter [Lysinibacillus sp. 2017]TGN35526.1 peptide MFS transporter [Lysinibacillus sp. S2017]
MYSKEEIVKSVPQTGFVGQPKGLFTLFFTEFWERFSYYGMRAILIFYMYYALKDGGLGLDRTQANIIMSIYGSLIYMSGIIGGWISDRITGTRKAVFYGGILIMVGHILLALPLGVSALYASMFFIIIGTGLLKPNVSSVVGDLYAESDPRRDSGFSIFYMGINMGSFIAPLLVGLFQKNWGFHAGFSVAAVGMFLGLLVFWKSQKNLGLAGSVPTNPMNAVEKKKAVRNFTVGGLIVVILGVIAYMTGNANVENFSLLITALGILIPTVFIAFMYRSPKTNADEKSRLLAYIPLFICAVMFWAIAEQSSTILATFIDTRTNLTLGSFDIPAAWFQSFNPLFIIAMAPLFAVLWTKLGDRGPSTPKKFAMALFFSGISFIIMIAAIVLTPEDTLVNPLWVVFSIFLVVVGELLLSPVGLSATTKLAPAAFAGQTMALWFLASAAAQAINAQLVRVYEHVSETMYFGVLGGFSIVLGVIILLISPIISKAMRGIK